MLAFEPGEGRHERAGIPGALLDKVMMEDLW